ncbi:hypothetical protein TrVE_jg2550 [Triparma verrucosa]|uniref:Uncharacterized protein n=1 Tax=Triparma verrucosa TaxID=1606542 RepID=A0A9W7CDR2_9STRA|nr:hypothetical protein TrVE_jg2550 [Triparma verrucosa]
MVLGVDFGTSSLRCALLEGDKSTIVEDRDGSRDTPSYVLYEEGSDPVLGRLAKQKLHAGQKEVLSVHEILAEGEDRTKGVDSASLILREVIVDAIEKRGAGLIGEVESVVTYAPNFTPFQQEILVDAAKSAGLIDPYVVCEPVGALIAARKLEIIPATTKAKNCIVVDVGHGVMHVSVVKDDDVVATKSSVIGGALLQDTLVQFLAEKFEEKNGGIKLRDDALSLQRLHDEVEGIAAELSKKSRVDVDLPYITADEKGPKHLNESISLSVVKSMVDEKVKADEGLIGDGVSDVVMNDLMDVLTQSKTTPFELGTVLVVGGASLSPIFKDGVKEAAVKMGGEDFMVKTLNVVEGGGREDLTAIGASLALEGI